MYISVTQHEKYERREFVESFWASRNTATVYIQTRFDVYRIELEDDSLCELAMAALEDRANGHIGKMIKIATNNAIAKNRFVISQY